MILGLPLPAGRGRGADAGPEVVEEDVRPGPRGPGSLAFFLGMVLIHSGLVSRYRTLIFDPGPLPSSRRHPAPGQAARASQRTSPTRASGSGE